MSKTAVSVNGKLVLKNVNRIDSGDYECSLPAGEYKMIKLSVYGRDNNDLNSVDIHEVSGDKKSAIIEQLDNELSEDDVDKETDNSPNTDVALKRGSYYPYNSRKTTPKLY